MEWGKQQQNVLLNKSTYPVLIAQYNIASVYGQIQKILGTSFLSQNNPVCSNVGRDKDIKKQTKQMKQKHHP